MKPRLFARLTITDTDCFCVLFGNAVEDLHQWHLRMLNAHPYFERIPDETLVGAPPIDPATIVLPTFPLTLSLFLSLTCLC